MEPQELLLKFKEQLKIKHYSQKTISSSIYWLNKFLIFLQQNRKTLKELTKEDILAFGAALKERGYSARSTERALYSVKAFCKYLEDSFYLLLNPADKLTLRRIPKGIPVVLSENEVKRILKQPETKSTVGIRDRAILELLYSTGIRLNELHNLNLFDLDTSSGFIRITKGKFSKDRFAPLTKIACIWLKEYLAKTRPHFTRRNLQECALFVGKKGRRLNPLIIQRLIKAYAKRARIKKRVTTHAFRHSFAGHLLANGVDIFKIQRLLGHSRASTTQDYTRLDPKNIKQAHKKHHPREKDKE